MQAERSAGVSFSHRSIFRAISTRFSCVTGTRLEVPVVPDVRKITAQDCAVTGRAGRGLLDGPDLFERDLGERCDGLRGLEEADAVPGRTRPIGQGRIGGHDQGIETYPLQLRPEVRGWQAGIDGQHRRRAADGNAQQRRLRPARQGDADARGGPDAGGAELRAELPDGAREITE